MTRSSSGRYAPLAKAGGGRVVLECPGCMTPLFSTCAGVDVLVAEGSSLPAYDVQAPLMSLPGLLGRSSRSVPADVPYLHAEPARVERWKARLGGAGGFKVGVVWQGNPRHPWDRWRSFPLRGGARWRPSRACGWSACRRGRASSSLEDLSGRFAVADLGAGLDAEGGAFLDTAAVMKGLDLVVTADTAARHLAGRWARGSGSHWRRSRTGGGCAGGRTRPGTRLCGCSGSGRRANGPTCSHAWRRNYGPWRAKAASRHVPVAPGELLDRVSILEIKIRANGRPVQLPRVRGSPALRPAGPSPAGGAEEIRRLAAELKAVNEVLWDAEDALRACEREGDFGPRFVELARSVYRKNDERAALERRVNELLARLGRPEGVRGGRAAGVDAALPHVRCRARPHRFRRGIGLQPPLDTLRPPPWRRFRFVNRMAPSRRRRRW